MSGKRIFFDTNIFVYAYSMDPRAERAREVLSAGGIVGAQGLNEFATVARRKLAMSWPETRAAIEGILLVCPDVAPLTREVHQFAVDIAERHGFSFFDSSMLAAALVSKCDVFFSEDMRHGMTIDGRLRIENPFRAP
jgi:predicted nucleic acid-binding protein